MRLADNSWPGVFRDHIEVREIHVDWSEPENGFISNAIEINPSAFNSNICTANRQCATQPVGKFDGRPASLMYKIQYRNFGSHESMVMNHAVNIDNDEHIGIRWYEIEDKEELLGKFTKKGHMRQLLMLVDFVDL